jgi:hypothetical protein
VRERSAADSGAPQGEASRLYSLKVPQVTYMICSYFELGVALLDRLEAIEEDCDAIGIRCVFLLQLLQFLLRLCTFYTNMSALM